MSRGFMSVVDVFFGGSGKKHMRDEEYNNPYRDKAAVDPRPDPIPAAPATPTAKPKPDPVTDPNPFDDGTDPVDGTAQPDPAPQTPPADPTDPIDPAGSENPYRRRAASTAQAPTADEVQDLELEQLFRGYAMRFHRRYSRTPGGPEIFYDLVDVQEYYSREQPGCTEETIMQQIWQDLESGRLVVRPVALDFNGKAVDFLLPDHPMAKVLQMLYERSTGVTDDDPPASPAPDPQPQSASTADPQPAPQPPTQPADPQPAAPSADPAPQSPQPPAEAAVATATTTPAGPAPASAAPNPEATPKSSTIGLNALIEALPDSERSVFYAQLAQTLVSGGGLDTQDLAMILATSAQNRTETPVVSDLPNGFEPISAPTIN